MLGMLIMIGHNLTAQTYTIGKKTVTTPIPGVRNCTGTIVVDSTTVTLTLEDETQTFEVSNHTISGGTIVMQTKEGVTVTISDNNDPNLLRNSKKFKYRIMMMSSKHESYYVN